jgi:hypothetical protein
MIDGKPTFFFVVAFALCRNQRCNSSLKATTRARGPLPILRTGKPDVRSQRWTVLTAQLNSVAISFHVCSIAQVAAAL